MPELPFISIALCTYNGARFLQQQVDSLLRQTYTNFEIIVADDCSTDNTRQLLNQWRDNKKFTIIYNRLNIGYTRNFEQVASLARGEFVAFCDQDDIWMPNKLQRLITAIDGYSAVFSDSILIDEDGKETGFTLSGLRRLQTVFDTRSFTFANMVSGHTMLVRRNIIRAALPVPEGEYHDWWIAAVAAAHSGAFYLDEALTYYRQHGATVTTNIITKKELKARSAQKRAADFRRDLRWMESVISISRPDDKRYLEEFLKLYRKKENGRYVWALFYKLLKERKVVFRFSKKKWLSQLAELRKMARGERLINGTLKP